MLVCYIHEYRPDTLPRTIVRLVTDPDAVCVGRGHHVNARVDDGSISRTHARVFAKEGCAWVEDLSSANGTRVEGERLEPRQPCRLDEGTRVELGENTWMYAWVRRRPLKITEERRAALDRLVRTTGPRDRMLLDARARATLIELCAPMARRHLVYRESETGSFMVSPTRAPPRDLWDVMPQRVRRWRDEHTSEGPGSAAMEHVVRLAGHTWRPDPNYRPRYSTASFPQSHEYALAWLAEQALVRGVCPASTPSTHAMVYDGGLAITLPHTLLTPQEQEEHRPSGNAYSSYRDRTYYLIKPLFEDPGPQHAIARGHDEAEALTDARASGALYAILKETQTHKSLKRKGFKRKHTKKCARRDRNAGAVRSRRQTTRTHQREETSCSPTASPRPSSPSS